MSTHTTTRVKVEIHTHEQMYTLDWTVRPELPFVLGATTHKAFGDAAGTFSISLKPSGLGVADFLSRFADPEDNWVRITWYKNGVLVDGMVGLTDSMVEGSAVQEDGTQVSTIEISGSDHGKTLNTDCFINIHETGGSLPFWPVYSAVQESLIGSPDEICKVLLRSWLGNIESGGARGSDRPWLLPRSIMGGAETQHFYDWLQTGYMAETRGHIYTPALYSVDQPQRLWDSMQEYSNGCLNELWCDLEPPQNGRWTGLRPAVYMRERPFPTIKSNDRWNALTLHRLKPAAISKRDIVSDGTARFNYWALRCVGAGGSSFNTGAAIQSATTRPAGQPGNTPIYDLDSIRKHGLRRYEQSTRYVPLNAAGAIAGSPQSGDLWLRIVSQWLRMIHDWYVIAPQQYTGTLHLASLNPKIRLGDRVQETRLSAAGYGDETWDYYVEGVSHSYRYPNHGETSLSVTRGQPQSASFLQRQYQLYSGVDSRTLPGDEMDDDSIAAIAGADAGTGDEAAQEQTPAVETVPAAVTTPPASEEEVDVNDADFVVEISESPRAQRRRRRAGR